MAHCALNKNCLYWASHRIIFMASGNLLLSDFKAMVDYNIDERGSPFTSEYQLFLSKV